MLSPPSGRGRSRGASETSAIRRSTRRVGLASVRHHRGARTRIKTKQDYIEFVTARLPTLRRLGYHLCGDENHADGLVQQMLTKLYVRWRRLHDVERLDPYVRTMPVLRL